MIDEIESEIQSPGGIRLFMYEVKNLEQGLKCRNEILKQFQPKINKYLLVLILLCILFIFNKNIL